MNDLTYREVFAILQLAYPNQIPEARASESVSSTANENQPIDTPMTVDQARQRLVVLRDIEIASRFPDADKSRGLLRQSLLGALLTYKPTTLDQFVNSIPQALRLHTDKDQIEEYLDAVLETLKLISED